MEVLRLVPAEHQGLALAGWLRLPVQHALKARKTQVGFFAVVCKKKTTPPGDSIRDLLIPKRWRSLNHPKKVKKICQARSMVMEPKDYAFRR